MSSSPRLPDPEQQPSLWKSMMDRLLGGSADEPIKPVNDPLDMEGLDLDLLQESERRDAPAAAASETDVEASDSDGFGEELDVDEEPEAEEEEETLQSQAKPPVDDYWNALEGLSWEDEDEPKSKAVPPKRDRSGGESRTPRTSPSLAKVDQFLEDDDFGAGLSEPKPAAPATAAAPAEGGATDEHRGPRHRRGGRGRRGGREDRPREERPREGRPRAERPPVEAAASEERADEPLEEFAPQPRVAPRRGRHDANRPLQDVAPQPLEETAPPALDAATESDDFGAGLEVQPARPARPAAREEQRPERGGRGRGRRGRGGRRERPETTSEAVEPAEAVVEEDDVQELTDDSDTMSRVSRRPSSVRDDDEFAGGVDANEAESADEEGGEAEETAEAKADRYRNIPSWEQAIALLVQPKRRPGDSSRSGDRSRHSRGGDRPRGGGRGRPPASR